ncbi:MAG: GNAT family N-acetyltransferase [Elusimicrobia bacterium]|nr:GNAT family N-acetyltransferase [Candidatus Obscuribacterium magneticum]
MPDTATSKRLIGRSIYLIPFDTGDLNEQYLGWLNDPEVNKYSRRRYFSTTKEDAVRFLQNLKEGEEVLAIMTKEGDRHIGNIQYGPIDSISHCAEIRILIGDKSVWGKGFGTEAIYLLCKHLFLDRHLHRVEANSCNPSFLRCVEKLGWSMEGRLRERFRMDETYLDFHWMGILSPEFKLNSKFEPIDSKRPLC